MTRLDLDADTITITALVKGEEHYILTFNSANKSNACRQLGRWASDRELSFTWYDAAILATKIREAK